MKRNIAAVVLAAGSSSRMGKPKQLLQLGATTLLRRIVRQALASNVARTAVVLGAEAERIRAELSDIAVSFVENARWAEGIGTSIAAGVAAVSHWDGIVILACDQPHVSAATINQLIAKHEASGQPIVAASYSETLGVPAFFAREYFSELQQLAPDEGAKRLLLQHRESVATLEFHEGAVDLDTPGDYERFLAS